MADLHYVLEVEPLDLGSDVKAVGLDLMEVESREPAQGLDAAKIWSASLLSLAGSEPWGLDFFAHIGRVREYCQLHKVEFEDKASNHCVVIPSPPGDTLAAIIERFRGETFGARAGTMFAAGDSGVESELASRGVDAYHAAFHNYLFCAVCDFENGFLTLITDKLWTSEVLRRVRPAVASLPVEVARPQ